MAKISDITSKIRSKNAGPFVLTIDLFCDNARDFAILCAALPNDRIAAVYQCPHDVVRRFELPELLVLKFSMPRPTTQGSLDDRDMHASQWSWLLAELSVTP